MDTDVAIVGAGPYGLSLAAHLRADQVKHRIFGRPMDMWRNHMPEGMLLKSDGFASSLFDPGNDFPLSRFCADRAIDYSDDKTPVRLQTFIDYALAFKDRFAPELEETIVDSIRQDGGRFVLDLSNGTRVKARCVVVAIGVERFRYIPSPLDTLPAEFVSHSHDHHDLSCFAGRRVAVLGAGASAIDLAGLLNERDCEVHLICRSERLKFASPPMAGQRTLWQGMRHPPSGLGPGWRSRLCADAPLVFHFMPQSFRQKVVRQHLGPAAGWPMRDKVIGRVPVLSGHEMISVAVADGHPTLTLRKQEGVDVTIQVDHVIAATGYRVDIRRLEFLEDSLLRRLAHVNHSPTLSTRFESSVEGLFFVGPIAANSFGPLMRFAFGAGFASRRVTPALRRLVRSPSLISGTHQATQPNAEATPRQ
jgi:thioredoxin reductase